MIQKTATQRITYGYEESEEDYEGDYEEDWDKEEEWDENEDDWGESDE